MIVFLDTMTFMHFKPIEQLDWQSYTGEKQIEVVVSVVVLREINKKKYDQRLQDRARRSARFLLDNDGKEIRSGITLRLSTDAPTTDDPVADHQFLSIVQKFIADHPSQKVAIFTEDTELLLLCKAAKVPVIEPREGDLLPLPQDENAKKLKSAEAELARIKNRLPAFAVNIVGGAEIQVPQRLQPMTKEQANDFFQQTWPANEQNLIPRLTNGGETNIQGYGKIVRQHAEARNKWVERFGLVYPFRLSIENTGTDVATGIKFWLEFQDPVSLVTIGFGHDSGIPLICPTPEEMPNMPDDKLHYYGGTSDWHVEPKHMPPSFKLVGDIFEIRHTFPQLTPHFFFAIPPAKVRPFEAEYEIFAKELSQRVKGKLVFKPQAPDGKNQLQKQIK